MLLNQWIKVLHDLYYIVAHWQTHGNSDLCVDFSLISSGKMVNKTFSLLFLYTENGGQVTIFKFGLREWCQTPPKLQHCSCFHFEITFPLKDYRYCMTDAGKVSHRIDIWSICNWLVLCFVWRNLIAFWAHFCD